MESMFNIKHYLVSNVIIYDSKYLSSNNSYEIQEEGPVQQISYASEIGSAVLKIVEQVDIMRFVSYCDGSRC